ncbi:MULTISPECIES: ExbD/TolR family protein [Vibrio]|uniref:ExbD/TolR family protein n=1 Tax=Vibrio TaxID=662 RepID=UPI000C162873|nr:MULTISPECIES: biopolymer transporter ExbD [Vibrio]NAW69199.1 biopolymer transporter ExbD [Vibrio sp. V28_P6S34P95]NAX05398.1 biopolymer transporter ExbD [Vibrio sp. V30_P3S12P165]NAX34909.1 biopolymer transporter ExbD [Vibrio sp. V29_P1S30P107]NAX37156.1 biopolymer transporter ExbD [Vibrio sp. V27_P1S3P104]NAX39460.1 biopolymer transporter ExbD [Vibrio sp. V26_P1S5P106]
MRFRHSEESSEQANVDMTPLIDVVFILLIFFILSASFQQQNQIKVERPNSQITDSLSSVSVTVSVDEQGQIWLDNQAVEVAMLTSRIKQKVTQANNVSVVIDVDKSVNSGRLIQVIDKVRIAGVNNVAVATES